MFAEILGIKPFFNTPKLNEAESFVDNVVSNSIFKSLKFHEIWDATQNY